MSSKKVVLITGASSGIGLDIAEKLQLDGYEVFGTSRKGAQPNTNYSFKMVELDVTKDGSVATAVAEVMKNAGKIDVLINNAGVGISWAAAEESSIEQSKFIFDTNLFGVMRMTQAVLPHMREQGSGRIINIGSISGIVPVAFGAIYSASKHALEAYTEALDHEVRNQGIRVSVIDPHLIKTPMFSKDLEPDRPLSIYSETRKRLATSMEKQLESAEETSVVADTVLYSLQQTAPHIRYTPGRAKRFAYFRYYAPSAIFDRVIQKFLDG